jgi:hypothetical protein
MPHVQRTAAANLRQSVQYRARRIGWSGKNLQHLELAVRNVNTIRERAAGINRYAQNGPLPHRIIVANSNSKSCRILEL